MKMAIALTVIIYAIPIVFFVLFAAKVIDLWG